MSRSLDIQSLSVQSFATAPAVAPEDCICFAPPCICTAAADCVTGAA